MLFRCLTYFSLYTIHTRIRTNCTYFSAVKTNGSKLLFYCVYLSRSFSISVKNGLFVNVVGHKIKHLFTSNMQNIAASLLCAFLKVQELYYIMRVWFVRTWAHDHEHKQIETIIKDKTWGYKWPWINTCSRHKIHTAEFFPLFHLRLISILIFMTSQWAESDAYLCIVSSLSCFVKL